MRKLFLTDMDGTLLCTDKMCNAIPKVLQAADVITEYDHDHSEVAEIIKKYVLMD